MGQQFIVRSQGLKHHLALRTLVYDGVDIQRKREGGLAVFEIVDQDAILELVVKRRTADDCDDIAAVDGQMRMTRVYDKSRNHESAAVKEGQLKKNWNKRPAETLHEDKDENAQGGLDDSQNQPSIKRPKTSGCKESVPRSVTLEHSIAGGSRSNHLQPQGTPRAWGAGWGRVRGRGVRGNMPQTVGLAKNARHMESDINPTGVSLNHLHYKTLARRPENKKEHYVSHAVTIDQGGEARLNHLQQEIVYTKPHTFGPKNNDLTGADSSGTVPVTLPDQQKTSLLKGFYEGWRAGFKGAEDVTVPFIFPEKLIPIMARQKTPENTRHTGADSSGTVPETLTDQFKTSFLKGFYEGWRAGFKPVKRTNDAVPLIIPRELIATTLDKEFISKFTTRQRAGLLLSMNKDRPQTEITLDSYCQTCEENGGNKVLSRSSRRDEGITQSEPKEMQDEEQPTDTTDAVQGFVSNNDSSSTDTKIDDSEPSSLNDDSCSVSSSEAEFRRKAWLAIAPLYETGAWE